MRFRSFLRLSFFFSIHYCHLGGHNSMSIRSVDSRLEVLRNGQDIANRSLLYNTGSTQQSQQQSPIVDIDNESNNPISACSAPFELVTDAGQVHGGDAMAVHYYTRHGPGRCTVATTGVTGLGQGTKRTAEWLEDYNSRPEVQRGGPQTPSPVETEMSTPPNSLVPGLDVGELTQSSCCEDEDEELSIEDDGAYVCKCQNVGQEPYEKRRWTFSELLGTSGNGRRALVLYLVTNLVDSWSKVIGATAFQTSLHYLILVKTSYTLYSRLVNHYGAFQWYHSLKLANLADRIIHDRDRKLLGRQH
uniref:Ig-like domain-containing protein n=1 Tax=Wuchereria bancrofti TaxID=6293 RepID=A0A1I8EQI9_WUCBA